MQSDSSSIDTLKASLLRAVDAEYNVMKAEIVLNIIRQLEQIQITREQLQTTRLGREINTIRQKIDLRKKNIPIDDQCSELIIEIAQRAKKLLRSWQGLLNTSSSSSIDSSSNTLTSTNVDTKPRLILKVKFHSPIGKRKRDSSAHVIHGTKVKRRKSQMIETPSVPAMFTEMTASLPRSKTTDELFREMQTNQPTVLLTRTSAFNAMLHKQILDQTLQETVKPERSVATDFNQSDTNSTHFRKHLSSSTLTFGNNNWDNGSNAGSPLSSSSSSSSIASAISWPLPKPEQPSNSTADLATICASYHTVADLVKDHRQRVLTEHDARELVARPDLLLVPVDQLAFVYERERSQELSVPSPLKPPSSMTTTEKLSQPSELIALPFIDCPFEFDLTLDELVVSNPMKDA